MPFLDANALDAPAMRETASWKAVSITPALLPQALTSRPKFGLAGLSTAFRLLLFAGLVIAIARA
jgi:hypothetical protein